MFVSRNVPGTGYVAAGPAAVAAAAKVPIVQLKENVPVTDASSVALKEVDDAGPNGAVILNFTPPDALVILQAAQKLGIVDRVKLWGCSTPCNTDFLAKTLGPAWNHKLFVNAELTDPDGATGAEFALYRAILTQYGSAVSGGIGRFSQMGFVLAKFARQGARNDQGCLHDEERQRGIRGHQELQLGDAAASRGRTAIWRCTSRTMWTTRQPLTTASWRWLRAATRSRQPTRR